MKNRGVQSVLNGIISYLPSPAEIKPIYINNGGLNEEISHNNSGFCGLAYKVLGTKERGTLVYIRVYSGKLKNNTSVYNSTLG